MPCPKREELDALAKGTASTVDSARLRGHLKECGECRRIFNSMSSATLPIRAIAEHAAAYPFLAPPLAPDEMGRLGGYRVLKVLGQGGMGIVFLGEDIQLARPVALKVMRPEQTADPEGWQRFVLEARTMANIKHEHLVTVYAGGEDRGVAYFAMELLEGESLEARMRRAPRPDLAEILHIARQLAKGLAFIHDKNLVHRDLKPANIWLESAASANGKAANRDATLPLAALAKIKILDLGLVRQIESHTHLTATGVVMGTPDYMSPEQASGENVDARTDLFSLGAVLYYIATARKPFEAPTLPAVLMALASKTPTTVHELNRKVPKGLSDLIMELLSRHPKKRPASAHEVLARLDAIDAGVDVADDGIEPQKTIKKPRPASDTGPTQPTIDIQKRSSNSGVIALSVAAVCIVAVALMLLAGGILSWQLLARRGNPPAAKNGKADKDEVVQQKAGNGNATFLADLVPTAKLHWPHKKGGPGGKDGKKPKKGEPKWVEGDVFLLPVRFKGEAKPKGLFMHPPAPPFAEQPASVTYSLKGQYQSFETTASLNDCPDACMIDLRFFVYGNGKELWKSEPIRTQDNPQRCKVSVKDVDELRLEVIGGDPPIGAHAIWIDPMLTK